jgi:hypothetical protein
MIFCSFGSKIKKINIDITTSNGAPYSNKLLNKALISIIKSKW